MARLTHVTSGAIVNVTDEKAARMGSEWEPVQSEAKKVAAKKAAPKSDKS